MLKLLIYVRALVLDNNGRGILPSLAYVQDIGGGRWQVIAFSRAIALCGKIGKPACAWHTQLRKGLALSGKPEISAPLFSGKTYVRTAGIKRESERYSCFTLTMCDNIICLSQR